MGDDQCLMCEASRDGSKSFAEQIVRAQPQAPAAAPPDEIVEQEDGDKEQFVEARGKEKVPKRQRVKTIWVGGLQDDWMEEVPKSPAACILRLV